MKKAYRNQAIKYHPDKIQELEKEQATEKFQQLVRAYETLTDATKYDNW